MLKPKKAGEFLKVGEVNELIRAALRDTNIGSGLVDGDVVALRSKQRALNRWIQVYATEAIPAHSIFGVIAGASVDDPVRVYVAKIGLNVPGSPLALLTNDNEPLVANTWGWARPINDYDVARVQVTGTSPSVGYQCGVHPDSYGITGGACSYGLVCIGPPDSDSTVPVIRSREFVGIIGEVATTITAYDPIEDKLGTGTIKIQYADHNDQEKLNDALSPSSSPWTVPVFNLCPQAFPASAKVKADSVLGVGLVIQSPCTSSDGGGSSESESSESSSSSDSGSEGGSGCSCVVYHGLCQGDWQNDTIPYVSVKLCERDGSGAIGVAFNVDLPRSTNGDPAVWEGDVIAFMYDEDGNAVCVSEYMDDPIGTLRDVKSEDAIPRRGWRECTGSPAWDFTGRFALARDSDGETDETTEGMTGGHRTHGAGANDHVDHPGHTHTAHPGHTHDDHPGHTHADHPAHTHDDHPAHSHDTELAEAIDNINGVGAGESGSGPWVTETTTDGAHTHSGEVSEDGDHSHTLEIDITEFVADGGIEPYGPQSHSYAAAMTHDTTSALSHSTTAAMTHNTTSALSHTVTDNRPLYKVVIKIERFE